ncbi:DUF3048 domain-containing protein [Candidatus Poriferisocius sp.]|uniref:DUF3048 domain-containing protein n=1 Tax=Candidatus Poriferisocius sp. TaxID=3101276 RepID=UPI003B022606
MATSAPTGDGGGESPEGTTAPTNGGTGATEGDGTGDGVGEAPGDDPVTDPGSTETGDPVPDPATPTPTPGPTEPLTGEPLVDPSIMNRPALAVKIGTSSVGRPQTGINQADVLIEVRVETITRLFAVFHSQGAISLGPVRSARSSDADILANFSQPVYGHSGANPGVLRELSQGQSAGKLYELRWDVLPNDYWRIADRVPPWNLYTAASNIWDAAPSSLSAPDPLFEYRREGEALPSGAESVPGVEVRYLGGTVAQFVWDAEAGGWARWQDGTPHVDMARHSNGTPNPDVDPEQVTTANVVVLQTRYTGSAACSYCPEAITVDLDGGVALVFTDGHMIRGRWSRPSASQPWQVTDNNGNPVRLTPGQTFIVLPGGDVLVMVQDFAEHLLRNR